MIVETTEVPASLIVPPASAIGFAPTESTSPALVAALSAAIASANLISFEPEPDKYVNTWFARWSLTTVNVGEPVTSTASLNVAVKPSVNPSDLSTVVVVH